MSEELTDTIHENAKGPAKATGDSGSMEQHPLPLPGRGNGYFPVIPDRVDEVGVPDAAQRALGAERHENPSVETPAFVKPPVHPRLADVEAASFIAANRLNGRMLTWFVWGEYAIWHFGPPHGCVR